MQTKAVQVQADVYCMWDGSDTRYRLYVNNELFTERTWIWPAQEYFLQEVISIEAPPGLYEIKYDLLQPTQSQLKIKNVQVIGGQAKLHENQTTLEIL